MHGNHVIDGTYNEQYAVYVIQEDSKQAQDPLHDEMLERLEKTFGLQFASLKVHNVIVYVEGANESLIIMPVLAYMHAFTTHREA